MASGLLNTVRAGGNTITLALFSAVLITRLQAQLGDRSLAAQVASGDLTGPGQLDPYVQALRGTILFVAVACAVLGVSAVRLTRPSAPAPHPQGATMSPDRDEGQTAVLHYTVKPERLQEHLTLLGDVYAELALLRPDRLRWATYQIPGTCDFIEVVTGHPLPGPLPDLPAFQRYRSALDDRCQTRRFDDVAVVGSFAAT